MPNVTIPQLQAHADAIVNRAARGEQITVMQAGTPVAELGPVSPPALRAAALVARWRTLPSVDPAGLRVDGGGLLDPGL